MGENIQQVAASITPSELTHGGLGFIAVINGMWLDYLNPVMSPIPIVFASGEYWPQAAA